MSKFNPKTLFVFSSVITTTAFGFMGGYGFIVDFYTESQTVQYFGWIPLVSIISFGIISVTIGAVMEQLSKVSNLINKFCVCIVSFLL